MSSFALRRVPSSSAASAWPWLRTFHPRSGGGGSGLFHRPNNSHYARGTGGGVVRPRDAPPPASAAVARRPSSSSCSSSSSKSTPPGGGVGAEESRKINAPPSAGRQDDALSRYPNLRTPGGVLRGLDYLGTVTFAVTGSVTAAQSGLDVFGCCMVATVTAVGGGTIRDAVLLSRRPFWTMETEYVWMTALTGFATFFTWGHVISIQEENKKRRRERAAAKEEEEGCVWDPENQANSYYDEIDAALDALDSVGLAAFAIIGAQNGVRAGTSMLVSSICGMCTSTFGGMLRDLLCGRPVRIVHSNAEVYAGPALFGAVTYLAARRAGATPAVKIGAAMACCVGSRYLAIRNDIKLHTWDTQNDGLGVAVRKRPTLPAASAAGR